MKKVGLYFGSFNPIHVGHMIIAGHLVENSDLEEVWFVVSPQNPLKKKKNLLEDIHRLAMVRVAVNDHPKLKASNIEFDLPKPSYTSYTLQVLKEKYPELEFALIMGEDNIRTLHKWKNYDYLLENYKIYVYPRVNTKQEIESDDRKDNGLKDHPNVIKVDAPIIEISSTAIRNGIKEKKDVRYLLTEPVFKYLDEMNFYK